MDRRTWKRQLRSSGVRGACASVSDLKPILVLSATHLLWLVIPKQKFQMLMEASRPQFESVIPVL